MGILETISNQPANSETLSQLPQDSTVSTTTKEEIEEIKELVKPVNKPNVIQKDKEEDHKKARIKEKSFKSVFPILENGPRTQKQPSDYHKSTIKCPDSPLPYTNHFTDCPKIDHPKLNLPPLDYPVDPYSSTYPNDILQSNIAQCLGLPSSDPLLMESMAQGFALEEYVRVLNQEQQAKILAAKKQRPKKYKCPHCEVGFSNNGQLKGHIRIHTGERPFKCDSKDCGKTFTRNEELTRHKRIHSGLRPFPCTHCGKRFGRKDHLKKHARTHFQPRGVYAVPVMMPYDAWATGAGGFPFVPMFGY